MRVPCRWLGEYVDLGLGEAPLAEVARELAERLTLAGLEVEETWDVAPVSGLVVGHVAEVSPHPNADQLSVCAVEIGRETVEIVCGAPNVAAGQLVPVILPDGCLPNGQRITVRPLRGVASHGMICSRAELGLEESSAGIWALDPSWGLEPGDNLEQKLEFDDVILDISITSNRPDLLGIHGIAREVAAIRRVPLAEIDLRLDEDDPDTAELISVALEDEDDTPRYSARLLSEVKIGASPPWLQHRLLKAGMRPLSNIVDVTNYVMLELGHPLHPFDADVISNAITVRRARQGERFTTLDGVERQLSGRTLLITDDRETLAIAGIMGGERSEIREDTSRVLLEAATFDDALIRHASRELGLRTEASQRFGRRVDAAGVETASIRAAHWMQQLTGCAVHRGAADAYPHPKSASSVTLRAEQVKRLLGVDVPPPEIEEILTRLGLQCTVTDGCVTAEVPTRRGDLQREADLVEEVGRIYGYDRVPSIAPRTSLRIGRKDPRERFKDRARETLVGLGMDEAVHDGFELTTWSDAMGWGPDDRIAVRNPMHDGQAWLRVALLPDLLEAAGRNLNQGVDGGMLFEIGRVFPKDGGEHDAVAGVLFGRLGLPRSGKAPIDLDRAKGLVLAWLAALRIEDPHLRADGAPPYIAPGHGGLLIGGSETLGAFGVLAPALGERLSTTTDIIVFECDLDRAREAACDAASFVTPSRYPASKRDLSLLAPAEIEERTIRAAIVHDEPEIERLLLYDTYQGEQVAAGKKSLTYELVLRAGDRTLTDTEAATIVERIEGRLSALGISLRR